MGRSPGSHRLTFLLSQFCSLILLLLLDINTLNYVSLLVFPINSWPAYGLLESVACFRILSGVSYTAGGWDTGWSLLWVEMLCTQRYSAVWSLLWVGMLCTQMYSAVWSLLPMIFASTHPSFLPPRGKVTGGTNFLRRKRRLWHCLKDPKDQALAETCIRRIFNPANLPGTSIKRFPRFQR